jgi:hypothetical protein
MVNMQLEELFDYVEEIQLKNDFDEFAMKPCKHYQNILKKPMQKSVNYFDKYEPNKNNHFLTSPADVPMEWVKYIISFEKQQVHLVADDKLPNAYLMQKKNENQQQRTKKPMFQQPNQSYNSFNKSLFNKPNNNFIQMGKSDGHINQIKKQYEKPFIKQSSFILNNHQEYKPKYQKKEINRMEQKISCSQSFDKNKLNHFFDKLDDEYKKDFSEFLEYNNPYECFLSIMDPLFIGFGKSYHEEKVLTLKEYLLKNDQVVNSKTETILDSLMKQFKLNIIHIDTEKVNIHLTMNDQYATILLFNDGTKWYISYNENMIYSGMKSQKLIELFEN